MKQAIVTTPSGVYRTPGRVEPAPPIPTPSWRTLLSPLARAALGVIALVVPVALFDSLLMRSVSLLPDTRLVPMFDHVQNAVMVLVPASLLVLLVGIARRVAPSWRGMRLRSKVLYVGILLVAQSFVAMAGEAAVFFARGGLQLFAPSWEGSTGGPGFRTAHL